MYWLRSALEPTDARADGLGCERREIEATAPTYDDALTQLRAQVPTGCRLVGPMADYDRVIAHLHGRQRDVGAPAAAACR